MERDTAYFNKDNYTKDIRAIDARFEAQKIAFSPLVFCAVNSMIELGVLKVLEDSGDTGATLQDVAHSCKISEYAAGVLCDLGLVTGVLKIAKNISDVGDKGDLTRDCCFKNTSNNFDKGDNHGVNDLKNIKDTDYNCDLRDLKNIKDTSGAKDPNNIKNTDYDSGIKERVGTKDIIGSYDLSDDRGVYKDNGCDSCHQKYILGKIGWMLINDELTRVNFCFVRDVCYKGAAFLTQSFKSGTPEGLKVFGDKWATVYEALSQLPRDIQKSWFDFDHYYSDVAFSDALPIVFSNHPATICDIGGNTAKFAISCCNYDDAVKITIVDLPGQTKMARENALDAGFNNRIDTYSLNVLSDDAQLPAGCDIYWMSQFLDCFSLQQVTKILQKIKSVARADSKILVLEPLWDKQKFAGNAYSLVATSLYFSCIANGSSKMYQYNEIVPAIEVAGYKLKTAHHNLGRNSYTLLEFCLCG